jgi:hypothetical protein
VAPPPAWTFVGHAWDNATSVAREKGIAA